MGSGTSIDNKHDENFLEDVEAQKQNGTVKSGSQKVAPDLGRLLATYQLVPTFERSDRHHCFIDSLENIDNLPAPLPPPTTKQQIFDVSKYSHVDDRALKAPKGLHKQPLSALVEYLINGYNDDLSKVRVIYRWITAQPIDQLNIPKREPSQSHTLFQLWRIKHRKGNYAQLVSLLCRFAQLPCIIIHGKLKGSTYDVGEHLDDDQHYGEWNAVLVDGYWRFINAYWGTCAEGGSDETQWECVDKGDEVKGDSLNKQLFYACDENYFLTEPDQMISTHFPTEPAWQLKTDVVTEEQFQTQAFLKDRFYNLHMKLEFPKICIVKSAGEEIELQFQLPEDRAINLDFQYLLFRLKSASSGNLPRYDRYVFLQRKKPHILHIRVRSPVKDIFRFELVGKDVTITDPGYDYDWVAVYKFDFTGSTTTDVDAFPECPVIGWGPGRAAVECGMAPMSHFGGEIIPANDGKLEIKFSTVNDKDWNKMDIKGQLIRGGSAPEEVSDHIVHRVENGDIIFNLTTPKKGEYAFKVYANEEGDREPKNVCNYLITSNQKQENTPFPRNFSECLGEKEAFRAMGLKALTHQSGYIETGDEELEIAFQKIGDIDLSLNLSGSLIHAEMAKRLISEEVNGDKITYKIRFPGNGNYGLRLMGNRGQGNEVMYEYVVNYKQKKQKHKPREEKPPPEPEPTQQPEISSKFKDVPNDLRKKIKRAIEDQNDVELEMAIEDLKSLGLPTAQKDIETAEIELGVMKTRRELNEATEVRDMSLIKEAISKAKRGSYDKRLPTEMALAKAMLERLRNITKLMHAVLSLDQKTIAEIKGYQNPPPAVHRVMMATLLILGHWEEETEEWRNVQIALGKMGKDAIKRKIQELKIDEIPVDVALGARDLIRDFTLDQVRMVSAGGATFYVWVKGLTEEICQRNSEIIKDIRPRTSRRRRSTMMSEKSFYSERTMSFN
ncbi:uncharacterized protein LOC143056904 isoform X2 [Mytilus galloprovincialis]|uniref:uncharacterized protein LOC143056904 isoform X2 n=1 Tax=Mytilus galloprovincialis TaxID=29158 RepID=UPI003F7C8118